MTGHLKDMTMNRDGTFNITFTTKSDFRETYDRLAETEIEIEIRKYRKKRSNTANAYFHVLVNKIAAETGESDEQVKVRLVTDYGSVARDEDGMSIGFKLPAAVNVSKIYPYVRLFDQRSESGKLFKCYLVFKGTHEMDTKEMARLIDGAISEARELGIETDSPAELERMKKQWADYEAAHPNLKGE